MLRRVALAIALSAAASKVAPTEIRLFAWGENKTTQGTFVLDKSGADSVLARFAEYGNKLVVDYEHGTFAATDGKPKPAAGWIPQGGLSLKDDGLWAKIDWTDAAREMIEKGEYGYFSPSVLFDDNRHVQGLLPVALTNFPSMHSIEMLSADRRTRRATLAAFDDVRAAICEALNVRFGYEAYLVDVYDDDAVYSYQGRTWQVEYEIVDGKASFTGEPIAVERTYVPAEQDTGTSMPGESEEGEAHMKALLKALGLAPDAGEAVALSELHSLQSVPLELCKLTGTKSPSEALGAVAGIVVAAKKGEEAIAKLASLEVEKRETEVKAILEDGKEKIAPADLPVFLSICGADADGKGADPVKLKALVSRLPKVANLTDKGHGEPAKNVAQLSDAQAKVNKMLGITPEKFKASLEMRAGKVA